MPMINPTLPACGDPLNTACPQINTALQTIVSLVDGALDTANLAANSVSPIQLQAQSVTAPKIGFTLDQVPPPVADVTVAGQRVVAVADPTAPQDLVNREYVDGQLGVALPAGLMMAYGGSSAPTGWLLCDGSAISRTVYGTLFAAIGIAYGPGDGSTTFNIPDLRGRAPVGLGPQADVSTLGNADAVAAASRTPRHRHGLGSIAIGSSGSHTHTVQGQTTVLTSDTVTYWAYATATPGPLVYTSFIDVASHVHSTADFSGTVGYQSANTDAPCYQVVNYLIKT